MTREAEITRILADIDADADAGWCGNWAEVREARTSLIVTFADGSQIGYPIPPEA